MNFEQIVATARRAHSERLIAAWAIKCGKEYESLRAEAIARINEKALRREADRLLGVMQ